MIVVLPDEKKYCFHFCVASGYVLLPGSIRSLIVTSSARVPVLINCQLNSEKFNGKTFHFLLNNFLYRIVYPRFTHTRSPEKTRWGSKLSRKQLQILHLFSSGSARALQQRDQSVINNDNTKLDFLLLLTSEARAAASAMCVFAPTTFAKPTLLMG